MRLTDINIRTLPLPDKGQRTYFDDGLSRVLQVTSIPTTILIDRNGQVASRMNGFLADAFVEQLTERIKAVMLAPH